MHRNTWDKWVKNIDASKGAGENETLPERLKLYLSSYEIGLLDQVANDDDRLTLVDMPIRDVYIALNCILKVLAHQEPDNIRYRLLDGVQAALTSVLENLHPGFGQAAIQLYVYYTDTAQEEGE